MDPDMTPYKPPHQSPLHRHQGVVLPVSLILLIVIAMAGLVAARGSVAHDAVGHNLRTREVATQHAESALRHCEGIAKDLKDNGGATFPVETARIPAAVLNGADDDGSQWRRLASWQPESPLLITVPVAYDRDARATVRSGPAPQCVIERLTQDRFLITARGLSADATFDNAGQLLSGSEIWLQSILSPTLPVLAEGGGNV